MALSNFITETMQRIRDFQKCDWMPVFKELPDHNPDTLFIGCIDARLNPSTDIGIPIGNALIRRTISALVPPKSEPSQDFSETIQYALAHNIKHIVVMGHTNCGGLDACMHGGGSGHVHDHLDILKSAKAADKKDMHALEAASLRISLKNLRDTYPEVKAALDAGKLTLDGWIIDTETREISTYNEQTKKLEPMQRTPRPLDAPRPTDTLEAVRTFNRPPRARGEDPTKHDPELLLLTDIDARINPAKYLQMPYGKALIYRGFNPLATERTDEQAALQFSIETKKVKDVVLMLHTDSDKYKEEYKKIQNPTEDYATFERARLENDLRAGIEKLKADPLIINNPVALHGWWIDTPTHRIYEMNLKTGSFKPMGISSEIATHFRC